MGPPSVGRPITHASQPLTTLVLQVHTAPLSLRHRRLRLLPQRPPSRTNLLPDRLRLRSSPTTTTTQYSPSASSAAHWRRTRLSDSSPPSGCRIDRTTRNSPRRHRRRERPSTQSRTSNSGCRWRRMRSLSSSTRGKTSGGSVARRRLWRRSLSSLESGNWKARGLPHRRRSTSLRNSRMWICKFCVSDRPGVRNCWLRCDWLMTKMGVLRA